MEEKDKGKKEEIISPEYYISNIELDELKRLHIVADQAPNRIIGTINLKTDAKKNLLDYHGELAKKYKFNPYKVGINRNTGKLELIPKDMLAKSAKDTKKRNKTMKKFISELQKAVKNNNGEVE